MTTTPEPRVTRALELSIDHLDPYMRKYLDDAPGVTASSTPYGWLLAVPGTVDEVDAEAATEPDMPPVALRILRLAASLGAEWVIIDDCGQVLDPELLPVFPSAVDEAAQVSDEMHAELALILAGEV